MEALANTVTIDAEILGKALKQLRPFRGKDKSRPHLGSVTIAPALAGKHVYLYALDGAKMLRLCVPCVEAVFSDEDFGIVLHPTAIDGIGYMLDDGAKALKIRQRVERKDERSKYDRGWTEVGQNESSVCVAYTMEAFRAEGIMARSLRRVTPAVTQSQIVMSGRGNEIAKEVQRVREAANKAALGEMPKGTRHPDWLALKWQAVFQIDFVAYGAQVRTVLGEAASTRTFDITAPLGRKLTWSGRFDHVITTFLAFGRGPCTARFVGEDLDPIMVSNADGSVFAICMPARL